MNVCLLQRGQGSGESGSRQSPPQTQSADFVGFATQRPSSSGVYQALAEAAEESFSEPSYVVVNETVKQFSATGALECVKVSQRKLPQNNWNLSKQKPLRM